MAITAVPTIKIALDNFGNNAILYFKDLTGAYNAINNLLGYGAPGGVLTSEITSGSISLNYNSLGVIVLFSFTVVNNVVTAATLTYGSGSPYSILAQLDSTVFPFDATNSFNLYKAYGASPISMPSLDEDQVITCTYSIAGVTGGGDAFSYSESETIVVDVALNECIKSKYLTAGLDTKKYDTAKLAASFLEVAKYAAEDGAVTNAIAALNRAAEICDCNCDC